MGTRVYVRSAKTKWYVDNENQWCTDGKLARAFASAHEAEQHCIERQLTDAEIVIVRTGQPVLSVPLRARPPKTS